MKLNAFVTIVLVSAVAGASSLTRLAKRAPTCDEAIGTACNNQDALACYTALAFSLSEDEDGRQQCSGVISESEGDCSCSCDCGSGALFDSLDDYTDTFTAIEDTCISEGHPGSNVYDPGAGENTIPCSLT